MLLQSVGATKVLEGHVFTRKGRFGFWNKRDRERMHVFIQVRVIWSKREGVIIKPTHM